MTGILAAQDISYDRELHLQSHNKREEFFVDETSLSYIEFTKATEPNKIQMYFLENFKNKLIAIYNMDEKIFLEEGIQKPNEFAFNNALETIESLSTTNIFPDAISHSAEDGFCITFTNKEKFKLHFELYNSGELGYIIEDTILKKIIKNEDVDLIDYAVNSIKEFIQS